MIASLEGIIGPGKSTILYHLKKDYEDIEVKLEPYKLNKILPLFYANPDRWAFACQLNFLLLRGKLLELLFMNSIGGEDFIVERTILSDRYTFAEMLKEDGKICEEEWESYLTLFKIFAPKIPDIAFYINETAENCQLQIIKRKREMEKFLMTPEGLLYLKRLEAKHWQNMKRLGKQIVIMGGEKADIPLPASAQDRAAVIHDYIKSYKKELSQKEGVLNPMPNDTLVMVGKTE
jgi:deoxyadenosine/deoxycytidine kinase